MGDVILFQGNNATRQPSMHRIACERLPSKRGRPLSELVKDFSKIYGAEIGRDTVHHYLNWLYKQGKISYSMNKGELWVRSVEPSDEDSYCKVGGTD